MRQIQIKVSGELCEIDDATAIGVTFNGFDASAIDKLHLNFTNSFSLPLTVKNRKIFGFADNMNINSSSPSLGLYNKFDVELFVSGQKVMSGKIFVKDVSEGRVDVFIINDRDFIEAAQNTSMFRVTQSVVTELNDALNISFPNGANWSQIISWMASGDNDAWMPYTIGTLNKDWPIGEIKDDITSLANKYTTDNTYNLEDESKITTEFVTNSSVIGDYKSGHIYVNLKKVLDVAFEIVGLEAIYSASLANELEQDYLRLIDIVLYEDILRNYFFFRADDLYRLSSKEKSGKAYSEGVTFLDLFKTVAAEYAMLFDIKKDKIYLKQFNEIEDETPIELPVAKLNKRSMEISNISQKCVIGYSTVRGDANDSPTTGGLLLTCENKNINLGSESIVAFTINRTICGYFQYMYSSGQVQSQTSALDTTRTDDAKGIIIVRKSSDQTSYDVNVCRYYNWTDSDGYAARSETTVKLYRAEQSTVSSNGAYDLYADAVLYPEVIEVETFIPAHLALNFKSDNIAKFDAFPGKWYVSSISQWNPRLENQQTALTAIRIR